MAVVTADYRLSLLGPPTMVRGGKSWALPFERRGQLVVWLALAGTWVGRRELAATLWPDVAGPLASNNLRKTLFRMPALPWGDAVASEGGALRFDGDTDIAAFDQALRESRVEDALALWRGDPLAGFDDDDNEAWTDRLREIRDRLRATWRGAARAWLEGDAPPAAAVSLSARLLDDDPWDDQALALHLRWLERSGQAAAARQVHARFVQRVRDELGVAPTPALIALAGDSGAPARARPATVRAPSPGGGELDPGFVGRNAELRRIASLIESDEVRLVTLFGPGGVGKTRLARRALRELAAGFADGAAFVELEDVDDPERIAARVARELGLAVPAGEASEALARHLAGRRMLVGLDNVEHLAAGAPAFERWLAAAPGLKLIVTSRVRLGIGSEHLVALEGLACPEPEDADRVGAFDAVKLFARSAQRVDPAFRPEVEAAALIDICGRVGGLPLGLELAAAWTRVLSCAQIADELARGTELLRATDAARTPRHASIESVFERSWRLLAPAERDALAGLSVFRGGFTAEAAREVASAPPPVLASLADQSLLRKEATKDGARLHLHPLVLELAAARVAGTPAAAAAARAHARAFLRMMARAQSDVRDGRGEALRAIETEFENCRAAWHRAVAAGEGEWLARAAWTLVDFCDHRGRVAEGVALIEAALTAGALEAQSRTRAVLHAAGAHLLYRQDRYADARRMAARALEQASDAAADDEFALTALGTLGGCALQLGELDASREYYEALLRRAPEAADPISAARACANLALVEKAAGRYDRAREYYEKALATHRQVGDVAGEVRCLHNLALLHLSCAEVDAADARLASALALCERNGFASTRAIVLGARVEHARLAGDFEAAERHVRAALAAAKPFGLRGLMCGLQVDRVHIAAHRRDLDEARAALADAAASALELGRPSLQFGVAGAFAELLAASGRDDGARRLWAALAGHPATSEPERDAIRARLSRSGGEVEPAADADPVARDLVADLPRLARRIVAEAGIGYATLAVELGGSRADPG
ncbi:MAG: BTAD domain-containing putative transcriptional regulator [Burkholderiales bacterium]